MLRKQVRIKVALSNKAKSLPGQALHHVHYSIKRNSGKLKITMVVNNEFNKLQINEVIDKDANGNVLKRSLMLNIRCNDVDEADRLYRQLKAKLNGNAAVKNGGKNGAAGNAVNGDAPVCQCGRPMILRNGRNGAFYGCSSYPKCRKTRELNQLNEMVMADMQVEEIQVA